MDMKKREGEENYLVLDVRYHSFPACLPRRTTIGFYRRYRGVWISFVVVGVQDTRAWDRYGS
jgi:hypothetical protein